MSMLICWFRAASLPIPCYGLATNDYRPSPSGLHWRPHPDTGFSTMTSSLDGAIIDGRHHMQIRVYYEDTDFSGIVYHANYLRFMERGRTNHLRLMGAEQHALFAQALGETPGFAFVVRSMQIDYLKPARMDDVLEIITWPREVKGASITLGQEVRRDDDLLVKAQVRVAFICDGRAMAIPKALRALMKADAG